LEWKTSIEEYLPSLTVHCWMASGKSISACIKEKAEQINTDLVIIGKRNSHNRISFFQKVVASKIAQDIGRPVLTVKPGCLHNKIKTLVIPITENFLEHKMEAIIILLKKFDLKIHMVTFVKSKNEKEEECVDLLLQNCQWLKQMTDCTPEYAVLKGANKTRSILAYANKINADVLIVHPTAEVKIGWFAGSIPDVLPENSNLQVLAVQ
jgi:nucleotide-binding universal stress UspA family protein